jgi:ADP-heptose:LPS heptosyltransferase
VFHIREWSGAAVSAEPHLSGVEREKPAAPYLLLHPGASWRYKQWSAKNVAALIRWLDAHGHTAMVVGGPNDRPFVDAIRAEYGSSLDVVYPSLSGLYDSIANARAVICNNSSALHIAEALGTPCIALTGPSDPVRWGTYRAHSRTLERSSDLPCHPCGDKRCVLPNSPCIDRLVLADVIGAVESIGIASAPIASLVRST